MYTDMDRASRRGFRFRPATVAWVLALLVLLLLGIGSVTLGGFILNEVNENDLTECTDPWVSVVNQFFPLLEVGDFVTIIGTLTSPTNPSIREESSDLPWSGTWTGLNPLDPNSIPAYLEIVSQLVINQTFLTPSITGYHCDTRQVIAQATQSAIYRCQNVPQVLSPRIEAAHTFIFTFDLNGRIQDIDIYADYSSVAIFYNCTCAKLKVADVVQIGVGSSASIVARRVTDALPGVTYYALEMGLFENDDPNVNEVANFLVPYQDPKYSRQIDGVPDPNVNFQRSQFLHGNMLGGSGNHDFMQVIYPPASFCNTTLVIAGGLNWAWPAIEGRLANSETFVDFSFPPSPLRGTTGPLSVLVVRFESVNSTSDQMLQQVPLAFPADASAPLVDDYNLGQDTSITFFSQEWYRLNGAGPLLRSSPGLDYIGPIIHPDGTGIPSHANLTVEFGAMVDKLLIDGNNQAYAVQYVDKNGNQQVIYANREIIISAGALETPAILERSGIGNKATVLDPLGIPSKVDNPNVGEHMLDHPGSVFIFNTNTSWSPIALSSWYAHLSVLPEMAGKRLMQVFASAPLAALLPAAIRQLLDIPPPGMTAVGIFVFNLAPLSEGSIHIVSSQPAKEPRGVENSFTDATNRDMRSFFETMYDLKTLVGLQAAADPSNSYQVAYPTAAAFADATNVTLQQQIVDAYVGSAHWSCTARMSPSISTGVVDGNLKVYGLGGPVNVRIIDNSVMPGVLPNCSTCSGINPGNTRASAIYIAETGAELVIFDFLIV